MNNNDSIRFACPHCQKRLRAAPRAAGKRIRCPSCTNPVMVPAESIVVEAEESSVAAPPPARAWRWLFRLTLTVVMALVCGGIGYVVADSGFKRETSVQIEYDTFGRVSGKSGSARLSFYSFVLIESNDLGAFVEQSNRTALLVMGIVVGLCGLFGGSVAYLSLRRVTRWRRPSVALPSKGARWPMFAAVALLALCAAGGGVALYFFVFANRITQDNYDRINGGMTEAQVEALLGKSLDASTLESRWDNMRPNMSDVQILQIPEEAKQDIRRQGPLRTRWMMWGNENRHIMVLFAHGRAIAKKSKGL